MSFAVDHLVVCVSDLTHNPYPLVSLPGGRHVGHGTENRIIPLGEAYIELVAVVDDEEAASSSFGRWVQAHSGTEDVDALCLRASDIDQRDPVFMSRLRPDGVELSWKLSGLEEALAEHLPFFIGWDDMDLHPSRSTVNGPARIESVTFTGDRQRLLALTGEVSGVRYVDGPPSIEVKLGDS